MSENSPTPVRTYFIPGQGYLNAIVGNSTFVPGWGYINQTVVTDPIVFAAVE